jgi:hypothetical protein
MPGILLQIALTAGILALSIKAGFPEPLLYILLFAAYLAGAFPLWRRPFRHAWIRALVLLAHAAASVGVVIALNIVLFCTMRTCS